VRRKEGPEQQGRKSVDGGFLSERLGRSVSAEDFVAYMAATTAHPAFTARFQNDLFDSRTAHTVQR
jgi:hypothetical protein